MISLVIRFIGLGYLVGGLLALVLLVISAGLGDEGAAVRWVALGPGGIAVLRIVWTAPAIVNGIKIRRDGVVVPATVVEIERRVSGDSDSRRLSSRLRLQWRWEATIHEGVSRWGGPHRTGLLAPGARTEVKMLPSRPDVAFWVEDLGLTASRRTRKADYERLFAGADDEGRG